MNRILIIGGTGNIGREVVTQLTATRAHVRALVRNPDAARLPPQVEVMRADLTCPDTLDPCLSGIDTVFLVWTAPPAAVAPAIERIAKHARRIVFLSAPLKTPHPFFQQPNPSRLLAEHIERTIEASGLEWTHLRPGMFALNSRHFWGPQIRAGGIVRWPYLAAPTAPIDERDIAAVAVLTLTGNGHAGMEYVLTGPQSLSQHEQISTIGSVIGRPLLVDELSPDQARREGLAGMPAPVVSKLLDAWAAAIGQPAFVTSTVREMTGRPARTFLEWVTANAAVFRA
ncbi:MAG TPA: NAD(P)H-binding protein [Candidatus Acidoferrales bacterium]|nr:NAD(P)H-binding protein [Candidatus Acidoferrales bacterium]HXK05846.1 NAD(P)H-binding protein [Verrucomicrobiae bacterium]